jgi:hypothetical protein
MALSHPGSSSFPTSCRADSWYSRCHWMPRRWSSSSTASSWTGPWLPAVHRCRQGLAPEPPSPLGAGVCETPIACPLTPPGRGCRHTPALQAVFSASGEVAAGKDTGKPAESPFLKGTLIAQRTGAGTACGRLGAPAGKERPSSTGRRARGPPRA